MSKITKKYVFIPEAFIGGLEQFDTLENATALEGTNRRGVLVEVSRMYDVNIPKEPKYLFFQVGNHILENYIGRDVYTVKNGVEETPIKLVKIVQITPESFMVVGTKNGQPYSVALSKLQVLAVPDDVFGSTYKEYFTCAAVQATIKQANHAASTCGHVQKPAVATSGITAADYRPVGGAVTPVKKTHYRYLKFTKQGAFIGEVSPEVNDRKVLQSLFERAAKTSGLALDNSTLSVDAFGFVWRRSKVR